MTRNWWETGRFGNWLPAIGVIDYLQINHRKNYLHNSSHRMCYVVQNIYMYKSEKKYCNCKATGSWYWVGWGLRSLNAAFPCWSCLSYFVQTILDWVEWAVIQCNLYYEKKILSCKYLISHPTYAQTFHSWAVYFLLEVTMISSTYVHKDLVFDRHVCCCQMNTMHRKGYLHFIY
jgi:hypothetical protein